MMPFSRAGLLSLCLLAGVPAVAADNPEVERLATCQDSWFEWRTQNTAQLDQVITRFRTNFTQGGNDGSFVPKASQTVIGLAVVQAFPQTIGMGVGFSIVVEADFNRTKAILEKRTGRTFKCEAPSDGMRSCELSLGEKKTLLVMAPDTAGSKKVIAHPTGASASRPEGVASTLRSSPRTERPLAFAVLITERKAA